MIYDYLRMTGAHDEVLDYAVKMWTCQPEMIPSSRSLLSRDKRLPLASWCGVLAEE